MSELNIDISAAEESRALHRVVRAMHDGHCPACGHLGSSTEFYYAGGFDCLKSLHNEFGVHQQPYHRCPYCSFTITEAESEAALATFRPFMQKNLEVFEAWRQRRDQEAGE